MQCGHPRPGQGGVLRDNARLAEPDAEMSVHADQKPWTVPALAEAKRQGRRMAMLTAYDAGFARVMDQNGIDLVLVGDSLGMVVQGHGSDRKSTRLNSSHVKISYAVFCLKK